MSLPLPQAKNLSKEPPRSPRVRLGGLAILGRTIDKGRAVLAGTEGEYMFNCGLDQRLFSFKGVKAPEVRALLASGADDAAIAAWFGTHGTPKTAGEIEAWSDAFVAQSPYDDPERRGWFVKECARLGLDPAKTTQCDFMEADDRDSFTRLAE